MFNIMRKKLTIKMLNCSKGMSLIEVLMAVMVLGISFFMVIQLYGLSGLTVAKARYVSIATMIAKSELTAIGMIARMPGGWSSVGSDVADWDLSNYAPYDQKISAEYKVEGSAVPGKGRRVVLIMKWTEQMPGGEVERKMPFATFIMNENVLRRYKELNP